MNWLSSIEWIKTAPLLGVIGGLLVFIFYERRKKSLEIEKLRLEIGRMTAEESRIYRPTSEEIQKVLSEAERFPRQARSFAGSRNSLGDFGIELRSFLAVLLMYYGDDKARDQIAHEGLVGDTKYSPDPDVVKSRKNSYPEHKEPDPTPIHEHWERIRSEAFLQLSSEVFDDIDFLLRLLMRGHRSREQRSLVGDINKRFEV